MRPHSQTRPRSSRQGHLIPFRMKTIHSFRLLAALLPLFFVSLASAEAPALAPAPDDPSCTADDRKFMARAFELARRSLDRGDMPIGAVLVKDGKIICEY